MGKTLSKIKVDRALSYVHTHGRAIDFAHAKFLFGHGSKEGVIAELERFQNRDGGFFGLEPDFRTKCSSPMATSIAFQFLRSIDANPEIALIKQALSYLENTFDNSLNAWATVGKEVNNAPHAPWWNFDEVSGKTKAGSAANPTAELGAAFIQFSGENKPAWLASGGLNLVQIIAV